MKKIDIRVVCLGMMLGGLMACAPEPAVTEPLFAAPNGPGVTSDDPTYSGEEYSTEYHCYTGPYQEMRQGNSQTTFHCK